MPRDDLEKKPPGDTPGCLVEEHGSVRREEELLSLVKEAAQDLETAWRTVGTGRTWTPSPGDWSEYHLPHGYDRTRIVLLVRDPYWLHSYWEVGSAERERLRSQTGRELWEYRNILRLHDLTAGELNGREDFQDITVSPEARSWYLEAGRPGHLFQIELGVDVPGHGFVSIARSNQVRIPIDRISDVVDEEWAVVEEEYRRLYRMGAGVGPGRSSEELMESLTRRLARQMGSGAISSMGSEFRQIERVREFWLVVGTELIVYGATQPDATVTIDGIPVQLRPDGTFSARFALPDGERAVPVSGLAADGLERITITPVIKKETH